MSQPRAEPEALREALTRIKAAVVGDALPNWPVEARVTHMRGWIADVCDAALEAQGAPEPVGPDDYEWSAPLASQKAAIGAEPPDVHAKLAEADGTIANLTRALREAVEGESLTSMVRRHKLKASECPPGIDVVPVYSLLRWSGAAPGIGAEPRNFSRPTNDLAEAIEQRIGAEPALTDESAAFRKWWSTFRVAKGCVFYDDDFACAGWYARAALSHRSTPKPDVGVSDRASAEAVQRPAGEQG